MKQVLIIQFYRFTFTLFIRELKLFFISFLSAKCGKRKTAFE